MKTIIGASILALGLLQPAVAENTPHCDSLDRDNDGTHIDTGIDFENGELVFREDGEVRMIITDDNELIIDGQRVELDERGRELVARYYGSVEQLVDDAMDLAGDAAGLGVSAATEALALVFSGADGMDEFEARVEAEAREIEAQADRMCERFLKVEDIERELANIIPEFQPRLFTRD